MKGIIMPVRIFKLINTLDIGNRGGGAEAFAVNLAINLQKAGENVTIGVLCRTNSKNEIKWVQTLENCSIEYVFLNPGPHRNLLHAIRTAAAYCRQKTPDIVHSHSQIGSLVAVNLKMRGLAPLIVRTAHAMVEWGDSVLGILARQVFTKWIFPRAFDAQVGVSLGILNQLKSNPWLSPDQETFRITNAVSEEYQEISTLERNRRKFPKGERWEIITIGRLTKRKGLDTLIRSLPNVIGDCPTAHLTIVGDGKEWNSLNKLVDELRLNQHITFLGQQADVSSLLLHSDLFVLPSLSEGLPTVILEAMACGIPVIASRLPGVMEVVDDQKSGWLVEPGNVAEFAKAISRALESEDELNRVRMAAFQNLEKFKMDVIAGEYLNIYQRLMLH